MYYMLAIAFVAAGCLVWWSASCREFALSENRLRKTLADQKALRTREQGDGEAPQRRLVPSRKRKFGFR